jgi:hypothetical protein
LRKDDAPAEKRWNAPHSKRFATFEATNLAKAFGVRRFPALSSSYKRGGTFKVRPQPSLRPKNKLRQDLYFAINWRL